jgi:hypothetical protein
MTEKDRYSKMPEEFRPYFFRMDEIADELHLPASFLYVMAVKLMVERYDREEALKGMLRHYKNGINRG